MSPIGRIGPFRPPELLHAIPVHPSSFPASSSLHYSLLNSLLSRSAPDPSDRCDPQSVGSVHSVHCVHSVHSGHSGHSGHAKHRIRLVSTLQLSTLSRSEASAFHPSAFIHHPFENALPKADNLAQIRFLSLILPDSPGCCHTATAGPAEIGHGTAKRRPIRYAFDQRRLYARKNLRRSGMTLKPSTVEGCNAPSKQSLYRFEPPW